MVLLPLWSGYITGISWNVLVANGEYGILSPISCCSQMKTFKIKFKKKVLFLLSKNKIHMRQSSLLIAASYDSSKPWDEIEPQDPTFVPK